MLVLSRRENETILIGDNIEVTVLSINGGQVKIGINADRNIAVDRAEIRKSKNANKK